MYCMDVCVARQAIFNRQRRVYAYELLFRSNPDSTAFDGTDASAATTQVIANSLFAIGLDSMLCGKQAFLNLGRELLIDGLPSILPKEIAIFEVLETVEPDLAVLAACQRLRLAGYRIALDDFVCQPRFEPLTHFANFIKVDMRSTPRAEQERLVSTYQARGIEMLAEKVETYEEFRWARDIGYDYFQGYFFARPVLVKGRQLSSSIVTCLRLIEESQRQELDFDGLEALISEDVSFSYKLLRYVNSALFHRASPVSSIREALNRVGEFQMRRWILLATLPRMTENKPSELATLSVVRAHFCECVAQLAEIPKHEEAFLMGLFSLLDALIDRPLEEALSQVRLAPTIANVLLGVTLDTDQLTILYHLTRCYEAGDWASVDALAGQLRLGATAVGDAYLDATRWSAELLMQAVD